jgi:hypothetical protein
MFRPTNITAVSQEMHENLKAALSSVTLLNADDDVVSTATPQRQAAAGTAERPATAALPAPAHPLGSPGSDGQPGSDGAPGPLPAS